MRVLLIFVLTWMVAAGPLEMARDAQDRPALEKAVAEASAAVAKAPQDAGAQYRLALAQSYLAEVALEVRDKGAAARAAEAGIKAAEKAVALKGTVAENHRMLGTLCGQIIPANTLLGLKYGRCALDSISKAIELDPKNAMAYVSRGVGNYYLPDQLGGGVDKSIPDFEKALQLDPKLADAHLWLGLAMRKRNRNAEARAEFQKALDLNPKRVWIKQQLEKTPAK
jgi:tetratricopeptide (TPR) repeat protein